MYKWQEEIKYIIADVLHAKNPVACLEKYVNIPNAKKIIFILCDGNQETDFRKISYNYDQSKYNIVGIGNYKNTMVLSTAILRSKSDKIPINASHIVNIDSNIASMLPAILDKKREYINQDFFNLLIYIKEQKMDLSIKPYLLEDSLNSTGMKNMNKVHKCLLAFYTFSKSSLRELYSSSCIPRNFKVP